jgi:hypothetical protein
MIREFLSRRLQQIEGLPLPQLESDASQCQAASRSVLPPTLQCAAHSALAGWKCTVCHQLLCLDCAAVKVIPPTSVVVCGRCGQLAEVLLRKKGAGASLASRLPAAFLYPVTAEGLPAMLGIAMWLWLTSKLGVAGMVFGWAAALGSFFGLTRSTARGGPLELSDFQDLWQAVGLPLARFAVVTAPVWGVAMLAEHWSLPWLRWLALGLAALWTPSAFIGAATHASLLDLLDPRRVLGATAGLGQDFSVYVAGLLACTVVMVVSVPIALLLDRVPLPIFSGIASVMALIYGPMVMARLAGLVLLLHGEIFGWGDALDAFEEVLLGATPRGHVPQPTRSLPAHLPDAIELQAEPSALQPTPSVETRFGALELRPRAPPALDGSTLPSHGAQAAQALRRAMAADDAGTALDGFRDTGLAAAEHLSCEELVWLGQTAAAHVDFESAELAFRKAVDKNTGIETLVKARVMLARLLGERLGRRDEARQLMAQVAAQHPDTNGGRYATAWLEK